MQVVESPTTLELRRTPTGLWVFGLAFVVAGGLCVWLVLTRPEQLSARDQWIAALIGSGVAAGGLYHIATTFRTRVRLDRAAGRVQYERSAPLRRTVRVDVAMDQVRGAVIRRDRDSEGEPWYVLELDVGGVTGLYLAAAAEHGRPELERLAALIDGARARGSRH